MNKMETKKGETAIELSDDALDAAVGGVSIEALHAKNLRSAVSCPSCRSENTVRQPDGKYCCSDCRRTFTVSYTDNLM